jgi:hypothetical protein
MDIKECQREQGGEQSCPEQRLKQASQMLPGPQVRQCPETGKKAVLA